MEQEESKEQKEKLSNFTLINNEFLDCTSLTLNEKMMIIYLKRFSDNKTLKSYPGMKLLCDLTGLSKPTVINVIKSLEEKGIIDVRRSKHNGTAENNNNEYTLHDSKDFWTNFCKEKEPMSGNHHEANDTDSNNQTYNYNNSKKTKNQVEKRITLNQIKTKFDYDILVH